MSVLCDEKQSEVYSQYPNILGGNLGANLPLAGPYLEAMDTKQQYGGNEQWSLLGAKYRIIKEIGHGSFGTVKMCQQRESWLTSSVNLTHSSGASSSDNIGTASPRSPRSPRAPRSSRKEGDFLAMKIIEKSKLSTKQLKDIQKEIFILKRLSSEGHSNILFCYETFESSRKFYIVTELLSGDTLEARIIKTYGSRGINGLGAESDEIACRRSRLDETSVAILFCQICLALDFLHFLNIVHRDVKPQNLLFSQRDGATLKLIDFGLSGVLSKRNNFSLHRRCGTPFYVAPEVIDGRTQAHYDSKADMWSAGVILYLLFCGHLPFKLKQDEPLSVLYKQILGAQIRMDSYNWQFVSPLAKDLVLRLLTRDPSKRLSAKQVLEHAWMKSIFSNAMDQRQ